MAKKRIDVKGPIIPSNYQRVYDWIGWEATSPAKVQNLLSEASGEEIDVVINSGGGDVYAGSEIYALLKEYEGNVTVKIVGRAASAASIIAMAGNKVMISPTAQIMIHNARTWSEGDHRVHQQSSEVLRGWDKSIANAYMLKTGLSQEELLDLMDKESWLSAQRSVELKFADEIMFDDENKLQLIASDEAPGLLTNEAVQKLQSIMMKSMEKGSDGKMTVNNNQQTSAQQNQQQTASTESQNNPVHTPQAQQQPSVDFAAQERARLQAIDAIAANIDPDLVNEAKYGPNPMTAQELAFKAMQEGKMIQTGVLQAAIQANAASGAQGVSAATNAQSSEPEYDLSNLSDVNKVFQAFDQANEQKWAHRLMGGRI